MTLRRYYASARQTRDGRTQIEKRRETELACLKAAGRILDYRAQPFSLKLAASTHYRPDFLVVEADTTITLEETKGMWTDAARAKTKIAADLFPWFRFRALRWVRGSWVTEHLGLEDAA